MSGNSTGKGWGQKIFSTKKLSSNSYMGYPSMYVSNLKKFEMQIFEPLVTSLSATKILEFQKFGYLFFKLRQN